MGDIEIRITGVPAVISALEALKVRLTDATRDATEFAGDTLKTKARANFVGSHLLGEHHVGGDKPNIVTGNLMSSITAWPVVEQAPGRFMVQVNPTAIYSRVIELGARITPTNHAFLSWIGRRNDGSYGRIFKRAVTVPPYPYLRPATQDMLTAMNPIYIAFWREALSA